MMSRRIAVILISIAVLIALTALIVMLYYVFARPPVRLTVVPNCANAPGAPPSDIAQFIQNIKSGIDYDIKDWQRDVILNKSFFYFLSAFSVFLTLATSILAAFREGARRRIAAPLTGSTSATPRTRPRRWGGLAMIAMPALAATCSAVVIQFQLREIWGLRAIGVNQMYSLQAELLDSACDMVKIGKINNSMSHIEKEQESLSGISLTGRSELAE